MVLEVILVVLGVVLVVLGVVLVVLEVVLVVVLVVEVEGLVGGGAGGPRWPSRGIAHSTRLTGPHTPNKFWYRSQTGLGRINGRGIPLRLLNSCRLWS